MQEIADKAIRELDPRNLSLRWVLPTQSSNVWSIGFRYRNELEKAVNILVTPCENLEKVRRAIVDTVQPLLSEWEEEVRQATR